MAVNLQSLKQIQLEIKTISPKTKLLIVSKNQSIEDINQLLDLGCYNFGENKVQEALTKFSNHNNRKKIDLHLIGPLQTNKAKQALLTFNTIQSLDRYKLVDEILKIKKKTTILTKEFYIQVNIGYEEQKSGITDSELESFYNYCLDHNLNIVGIMCIPPIGEASEKYFKLMKDLRNKINKSLLISMGMSGDYIKALSFESNIIRIGSKIFNEK